MSQYGVDVLPQVQKQSLQEEVTKLELLVQAQADKLVRTSLAGTLQCWLTPAAACLCPALAWYTHAAAAWHAQCLPST
jgi:hypothetical protein